MSFILGEAVVQEWTVLDGNTDPLTGITTPAGIVFHLHRQVGSTMIAASETITWTEIGVTGHYYIVFTPLNTGLYVLQLEELDASSMMRWFRFPDIVVQTAGAVFLPSYANAFCAESDIERWIQHDINSTSVPSATQAAAFAESIAAILMSLCARWGFAVTPASVIAGSRIEDLLREANAIGAARFYIIAQERGQRPADSAKLERLEQAWVEHVGGPMPGFVTARVGYIETEVRGNLASLATNHILSGDTLAAPVTTPPTDSGVGPITMGSLF